MADSFQLKAILSAVDKLTPVLAGVQRATKNTRKYLSDLASAAGNVAGQVGLPLAALGGIVSGGLALALKRSLTDFASVGAALDDMSKRTGISAESLQLLQYQAEMSDVSMEGLQSAVGRLNKGIGEAVAGKNKDLAALFGRLNIELRDSRGNLREAADLLPQLADAFARNTSEVTRARMGNALFGKGYMELLPLLVDGSDALIQLQEEYQRLGLSISSSHVGPRGPLQFSDVELAAQLDDSFVKLRHATQGLTNVIGAKLAPVIVPLIDRFISWAAANRDVIATKIGTFVERLAQAVASFDLEAFLDRMGQFLERARELVAALGGMERILIVLGALMAAGPLLAIIGLVGAVGRLGLAFVGATAHALAFTGLQVPLQAMSTSMAATNATAASLVGTLGKLGAVIGVLGAGYAGWQVGSFLSDSVINPLVEKLTGEKGQTLGSWIYDLTHGEDGGVQAPARAGSSSSLAAAGAQRIGGSIGVEFVNAPAGMRVTDTRSTPGFDLNAAVGYRGFALDSQ